MPLLLRPIQLAGNGFVPCREAATDQDVLGHNRKEFINIGHRGASGVAPEHTIPAFDLALHYGAHYIELDVHLTSDGVPVVLHDNSLRRVARVAEYIRDKGYEELKTLDVGSWFNLANPKLASPDFIGLRIVTLEEVLSRYRHCVKFCIELKDPDLNDGVEQTLLDLLNQFGLDRQVRGKWRAFVLSFRETRLRRIHDAKPWIPLVRAYKESRTSHEIRARLEVVRRYAAGIAPYKHVVDQELVHAAHALDLWVSPYTVNRADEMVRLLDLGVDGMFTDFPGDLYRVLRERAVGDLRTEASRV